MLDLVGVRFVYALRFAFDFGFDAAPAVVFREFLEDWRRGLFFDARVGDEQYPPGVVSGKRIFDDQVVAPARVGHAGAQQAGSTARGRRATVVVFDDPIVDHYPADVLALRARRRRGFFFASGAQAFLRRGGVIVVLARRRDALLIVIEFGVLDRQVPAGVRS